MTKHGPKLLLSILLSSALILTGCTTMPTTQTTTPEAQTTTTTTNPQNQATSTQETQVELEDEDSNTSYNASTATTIDLAKARENVITISEAGDYVLTGSLENGQLIIKADPEAKVHLIMNEASISNSSGPALLVESAEKVIITLVKNTTNTLQDGNQYSDTSEEAADATLFSKEDLSINGEGTLRIVANYGDAIKSKDTLLIASGLYEITSVNHALNGKDALAIFGGNLKIKAVQDGLHSSNLIYIGDGAASIEATDDAIHADTLLTIDGGTIQIPTSNEGLEAESIVINGGTIDLVATDDGINAASSNQGQASLKITGGTINLDAQGDGLDVNGSIYISGGLTTVSGPTANNNAAMDYDQICEITGGTLIAVGSSGMAMHIGTTSTQNAILVYYTQTQSAGTTASLLDQSGKVLYSYTPTKPYQSILFTGSDITLNAKYTLKSNTSTLATLTATDLRTTVDDQGNPATTPEGMGGMGGKVNDGKGMGKHGTRPQAPANGQLPDGSALPDGATPPQDLPSTEAIPSTSKSN